MARPQKKGLDYFPLDTDMDVVNDDVMMLEAKYGSIGFTTLIKLYMKIYQDNGYFMNWNEKTSLLLSKRINVSNNSINDNINLVNDIINDLLRWNVFSQDLYDKYKILTSKRIQETYLEAVKKRKDVEIDKRYLINGQLVNDNINLINVDINPQRREEKSKEEKSKEKNSNSKPAKPLKITYLEFVKLTEEEHNKLIDKLGELETNEYISRLNNYIGSKDKKYKSHYHTILTWWNKDQKTNVKKNFGSDVKYDKTFV